MAYAPPVYFEVDATIYPYDTPDPQAVNAVLTRTQMDFTGNGFFAGEPPDWLATIDDVASAAEVRVLYRDADGRRGDGDLVAKTMSAADGTWLVTGLNPHLRYDIVARSAGCNDVIVSNVSPAIPAP